MSRAITRLADHSVVPWLATAARDDHVCVQVRRRHGPIRGLARELALAAEKYVEIHTRCRREEHSFRSAIDVLV